MGEPHGSQALARSLGWEMEEPGWWLHDDHGGLVNEGSSRWFWYPLGGDPEGPFPRLRHAVKHVQQKGLDR